MSINTFIFCQPPYFCYMRSLWKLLALFCYAESNPQGPKSWEQ